MTVKTTPGHFSWASRSCSVPMSPGPVLETLVIASFLPGLSVRDVEAALAEGLGDQAAVSRSTVSSMCQQIKDEYAA